VKAEDIAELRRDYCPSLADPLVIALCDYAESLERRLAQARAELAEALTAKVSSAYRAVKSPEIDIVSGDDSSPFRFYR
jgi:hypothetical protein